MDTDAARQMIAQARSELAATTQREWVKSHDAPYIPQVETAVVGHADATWIAHTHEIMPQLLDELEWHIRQCELWQRANKDEEVTRIAAEAALEAALADTHFLEGERERLKLAVEQLEDSVCERDARIERLEAAARLVLEWEGDWRTQFFAREDFNYSKYEPTAITALKSALEETA